MIKRHEDNSISIRTRVIGCVAYFCEEPERVERVRKLSSGELFAEIVPELSQFRSGHRLWQVKPQGDSCIVCYISEIEPDIFITPVAGKFLIKKSIRDEMLIVLSKLEKISSVIAEQERCEQNQPVYTGLASHDSCIDFYRLSCTTVH